MTIKKNIALSDSGFVFDPSSGDSFSTNPIGLEIIKLMKSGKSDEEIKKHMTSTYMIDDNTFEKDFYDFVNMLQKLKIAEGEAKKK
ncbi:MAG: PqqD family protein [Flavobacteriales bacterium]